MYSHSWVTRSLARLDIKSSSFRTLRSRDPESSVSVLHAKGTGFRVLRFAQPRNDAILGGAQRLRLLRLDI